MNFFGKVRSSIYDPGFYSRIKNQSLIEALKYFFILALALTIINSIILSYELAVEIPKEIRNFISQTVNSIPQDFEVIVDNGQVTTNAQEPFFAAFPKLDDNINQENLNNILVIDTRTPYSATQFNQYKTLFWLTKDSLFYRDREFDQRSIDLTEVKDVKINHQFVQSLVDKINPWLGLVGPVLIALVFLGMFLGFTSNLLYFLILAVLIFFLASIFKWGLNYSSSYKIAVYSSTLSFFVDLVLFNTGLYTGFFGFPYLFTLTTLCIVTINLQNFDKDG